MILNNKEVLDLLDSLNDYFHIDLGEIIDFVIENDYEYNEKQDTLELNTYTELSDLFRRHIFPYNDIFKDNHIEHILLYGGCVFYYDLDKKDYIINNDELIIKGLDLRAFGKFVF